ncbi:hypothetical protein DFH09DRAFT_603994 [Mycena vulgaris]|nr:hypothetical protein DFH09DRAFT_603994 [Mycena vulgaris]
MRTAPSTPAGRPTQGRGRATWGGGVCSRQSRVCWRVRWRGWGPPYSPVAHSTTRGSSRGSSTRTPGACPSACSAWRSRARTSACGLGPARQRVRFGALLSVLFSLCPSISFLFGDVRFSWRGYARFSRCTYSTFTRDSPSTRPFLPTSLPLLALTLILLLPSSFVSIRPLHHSKYS